MIYSLQPLRFIFALMIFFHHFILNDGEGMFGVGGDCGVSFFMMLGGFVMAYSCGDSVCDSRFCYADYLKKRIIRIYPLHLFCLLAAVGWQHSFFSGYYFWTLLPNLFLLQSWIPDSAVYFSGNGLSWYLSDLMFFYVVFPFLWKYIVRLRDRGALYLISVLLLLYMCMLVSLPSSWCTEVLYIFPLVRLLDFLWGMLLFYFYKEGGRPFVRWSFFKKSIWEVGVVLLLVVWIVSCSLLPERLVIASWFWPIMALIIWTFASFKESGGCLTKLLQMSVLRHLSKISFSFYMIHQLVLNCLAYLFFILGWNLSDVWRVPLFLCITIGISYFVYYCIELPIGNYLRRKFLPVSTSSGNNSN